MANLIVRSAPSPHTTVTDGNAGRLVHAENPDRPGHALCGQPLGRGASAAHMRCLVCEDLARPAYWHR